MVARGLLLILGLVHVANGGWMLLAPQSWYATIPGVAMSGPLNGHFVGDVGLAFIASGAGLLLGLRAGGALFAIAGATWPALHGLFHIAGWIEHGFPTRADVAAAEAIGVVFVAVLGIAAAWVRANQEGAIRC